MSQSSSREAEIAAMDKRRYHHGSVRQDLVAAALEALRTKPADTISLRSLSRSIGVSATATYRHYQSKSDFMRELSATGRKMLVQHVERHKNGLANLGKAYLEFAIANPNLFGLMCEIAALAGQENGAELCQNADACRSGNGGQVWAGVGVIGIEAWALAYGLARLVLEGRLDVAAAECVLEKYAQRETQDVPVAS